MQNDPLFDIHGDMAELVAAKRAVPQGTDADTLRAGWNQYGARLRRPYPDGMVVEDTAFDVAGATPRKIALRIYRPRNAPQPSPCVLYLHGGGFVKGSLESGDAIAWGIAEQVGVVVVSIDYRLAPEHRTLPRLRTAMRQPNISLGMGRRWVLTSRGWQFGATVRWQPGGSALSDGAGSG